MQEDVEVLKEEKDLFVRQLAGRNAELARKFECVHHLALAPLEQFFLTHQSWQDHQGMLDWLEHFMREVLWDHEALFPYIALFDFVYQIEDDEFECFKEVFETVRVAIPW